MSGHRELPSDVAWQCIHKEEHSSSIKYQLTDYQHIKKNFAVWSQIVQNLTVFSSL
jgi:hypothetical protein